MFNQRDRMLAALFVVQLVAAVAFGGLLIHTLHNHDNQTTQIVSSGASGLDGGGTTAGGGSTSDSGTVSGGSKGGSAGGSGSGKGSGSGSTTTTTTTTTGGGGAGSNTSTSDTSSTQGGGVSKQQQQQSDKQPAGTVSSGAPIKIGSIVTETGGINFAASAQATKAYIDQVDAAGGVDGHQIQLLLADDQLSASRGQGEAQQMVNEGVFSFVGFNAPETEDQIVPFLTSNQVPLVGCYGEYAEYHSPWAYPYSASYGHYGYEMGKYLAGLGVKKPALIYIDNGEADANNGLVNAFEDGVKAGGGSVSSNDIFKEQPEAPSYDGVVTSLKVGGVDGIATILDEASYNRLQQSMDSASYHPTRVADPLWPDDKVTHEAQNNGTYVATDYNFVNPGVGGAVGDYVSAVKKAFGSSAQISYIGEQGWLDAEVFVDALKQLKPNDITRSALMGVLDKMNTPKGYGFTGPLVPTTTAHDISHCLEFGKWNGDAVEPTTHWLCDSQAF